MRYVELIIDGKKIKNRYEITKVLMDKKFYWLIDSEIENATIEIKNDTIIWHNGCFYSGYWHYGIFKEGVFYGVWENGIWENGKFEGKWISGIKLI